MGRRRTCKPGQRQVPLVDHGIQWRRLVRPQRQVPQVRPQRQVPQVDHGLHLLHIRRRQHRSSLDSSSSSSSTATTHVLQHQHGPASGAVRAVSTRAGQSESLPPRCRWRSRSRHRPGPRCRQHRCSTPRCRSPGTSILSCSLQPQVDPQVELAPRCRSRWQRGVGVGSRWRPQCRSRWHPRWRSRILKSSWPLDVGVAGTSMSESLAPRCRQHLGLRKADVGVRGAGGEFLPPARPLRVFAVQLAISTSSMQIGTSSSRA